MAAVQVTKYGAYGEDLGCVFARRIGDGTKLCLHRTTAAHNEVCAERNVGCRGAINITMVTCTVVVVECTANVCLLLIG